MKCMPCFKPSPCLSLLSMGGFRGKSFRVPGLVLMLAMLGILLPAVAQEQDAPKPRMVRLSDVEGKVQILRGGATEFKQAYQNMPLLEGARVQTGDDGRAEIEFEDGSLVRLTPNSSISLDQLSAGKTGYDSAISLLTGMTYLELRSSRKYSYLVDYPDGEFSPMENSTVRVNLDLQPADLAVFDGDVQVEKADSYTVEVHGGESLSADAEDPSRYFLSQSIAPDSWDQWNDDRDQVALEQAAHATTARNDYAGDVGYGWSDLDAYGNWYPVPGYGLMWQPTGYGDNFDPYGSGYWADYPTYGYVWVSGYPWGWTPFQCGSWSFAEGFGWGWSPVVGCGSYAGGWGSGFAGGFAGQLGVAYDANRSARYTNIAGRPVGYKPPHRPVVSGGYGNGADGAGGRPARIIPVGHPGRQPLGPGVANGGGIAPGHPVIVQGRSVEPLKPVPGAADGGLNSARSALLRDYPVNSRTHEPLMGAVPVHPGDHQADWDNSDANTGVMNLGEPVYTQGGRATQGAGAGPGAGSRTGSGTGAGLRQGYPANGGAPPSERPYPTYNNDSRPAGPRGGYTQQPSRPGTPTQPARPSAPRPAPPSAPSSGPRSAPPSNSH